MMDYEISETAQELYNNISDLVEVYLKEDRGETCKAYADLCDVLARVHAASISTAIHAADISEDDRMATVEFQEQLAQELFDSTKDYYQHIRAEMA
jgi:hypothetical protein